MSATEAPVRPAPPGVSPEGGAGRASGPMTWEEVCAHPSLQDLPFKVEQDRYGRIVMSPPFARHARLQYKIARLLDDALGGVPATEAPVETAEGIKVPDVVWMSDGFAAEHAEANVYRVAPEICVEVMSKGNAWEEMAEKVQLYLARGAQEVWIHEQGGRLRFFGHEGERERSALAPDAPTTVTL